MGKWKNPLVKDFDYQIDPATGYERASFIGGFFMSRKSTTAKGNLGQIVEKEYDFEWSRIVQNCSIVCVIKKEFLVKMFQVIATRLTLVNYHGH